MVLQRHLSDVGVEMVVLVNNYYEIVSFLDKSGVFHLYLAAGT